MWFVFFCLVSSSQAQFLYPVDNNPPTDVSFTCFACEGEGCEETRVEGTHSEATCTGSRIACWTIRNGATATYTRQCGHPDFIRQGVFCNRHMEGKEFCFGRDTDQGRVRICAKCCLNDRCNSGDLQNSPDPSLQTCFACDGNEEALCNQELSLSEENSTHVEQCLLPGSDCWTQRNRGNTYVRGCQLLTCENEGFDETCEVIDGVERCTQCCVGKLCNRNAAGRELPFLGLLSFCLAGASYWSSLLV